MWQKSLAWAQANSRHRKHPIHGEDQIQIVKWNIGSEEYGAWRIYTFWFHDCRGAHTYMNVIYFLIWDLAHHNLVATI